MARFAAARGGRIEIVAADRDAARLHMKQWEFYAGAFVVGVIIAVVLILVFAPAVIPFP